MMYRVFFLRGGEPRKSMRGATCVVVRDADTDELVGAVERHVHCPHWYQQAPVELIAGNTLYDSAEAALSALGINVDLS